jgi:hypothetical protein
MMLQVFHTSEGNAPALAFSRRVEDDIRMTGLVSNSASKFECGSETKLPLTTVESST